ncbi:MAG TPA: hypothetical protein VK164_03830 [Flavobacterium sp.]|uniref:hypothetical protein n=1 Tax=Flavobacterium sp. TaxID=239 RepID=UPI002B4B048D|nr:hypothetical protein [Flavobacterium sp.]HLO73044.1 hypothetical protein [Flavobacterium sp.]
MISNYLLIILEKLHFLKVVIARFFSIFFRKRKGIELLLFEYNTEYLFDNSFIIINYRFRNAIYYKFGNHKTFEKQIKIFNLKNFDSEFQLTVYGFFRKKIYVLKFEPKHKLESEKFKTSLSNFIIKFEEQNIPKLSHPFFYLEMDKSIVKSPKTGIANKQIITKTNSFNQNEFI